MNGDKPTPWELGRQAAAYFGLAVGVLWILSFALTMAGLYYSFLATFGLLAGLLSIYRCGVLVRIFRVATPGTTLRIAFRLCWLTFMLAALLTTMAQYIYFRWIDGGALAAIYRTMLIDNPAMGAMVAGDDAETIQLLVNTMEDMTPVQWTMNMMLYNMLLATVLAPVALIFARIKDKTVDDGHKCSNTSV